MSIRMLSDDDIINDINPFVAQEISLPGSVRQIGDHADFKEMDKKVDTKKKGLPEDPVIERCAHPRLNIDRGKVTIGVSNKSTPWVPIFIVALIIVLILLYVRR